MQVEKLWTKFEEQALSEGQNSPSFHGSHYRKDHLNLLAGWKQLLRQGTNRGNTGMEQTEMWSVGYFRSYSGKGTDGTVSTQLNERLFWFCGKKLT